MYHYLLVYRLLNPETYEYATRNSLISILKQNQCVNITSLISDSISFSSEEPISFWRYQISQFSNNIYYQLVNIDVNEAGNPIQEVHYDTEYRNHFNAVVASIN
jgi:hypothetical protein